MALEITENGASKLVISGTATELNTIYARINFSFQRNGSDCYGKMYFYGTKTQFESNSNNLLGIDGLVSGYSFNIDTAIEQQSLITGHEKIKADLENIGYTVAIVDL